MKGRFSMHFLAYRSESKVERLSRLRGVNLETTDEIDTTLPFLCELDRLCEEIAILEEETETTDER
jgi:hypothetical protein